MSNKEKGQSFGASVCMKFIERFGTQLVTIILNVVLARLLCPEDYGVLAILNVFIVLAQVITQYGINNALVQRQNPEDADYSTGLILSVAFSALLYFALFIAAPFIAVFYENESMTIYLRVLSLSLFPVSVNAVFTAILMKSMQFRKIMIVGIISNISACVIGVALAYVGFGVWALIVQQISSSVLHLFLLLIFVKWRYPLRFSKSAAAFIIRYGGTIAITSIIDNLYYDLESLLIGKWFSQTMLGYYTNARTYPLRVISSVKDTISGVVFPAMSKVVGNRDEMKRIAKLSINLFSFVVFPAMIGLALIAEEFVSVLLTEKWLPIVLPMQMFCISFAFLSISSPNIQVIKALGKVRMNLYIEIIRKAAIVLSLIFVVFAFNSIEAVAVGFTISNSLTAIGVAAVCGRQIEYRLSEQLRDIFKSALPLGCMAIAIWAIASLLPAQSSSLVRMLVKISVGIVSYLGVALLTKHPVITMLLDKVKESGIRRQNKWSKKI